VLGDLTLRALTIHDLERDYNAVMESAAEIRSTHPGSSRVIEDAGGEYLGCLYVYPSIAGESSADVVWWWRSGKAPTNQPFRRLLAEWLSGGDWPDLTYNLQDR
jgi:hypothetical protein